MAIVWFYLAFCSIITEVTMKLLIIVWIISCKRRILFAYRFM